MTIPQDEAFTTFTDPSGTHFARMSTQAWAKWRAHPQYQCLTWYLALVDGHGMTLGVKAGEYRRMAEQDSAWAALTGRQQQSANAARAQLQDEAYRRLPSIEYSRWLHNDSGQTRPWLETLVEDGDKRQAQDKAHRREREDAQVAQAQAAAQAQAVQDAAERERAALVQTLLADLHAAQALADAHAAQQAAAADRRRERKAALICEGRYEIATPATIKSGGFYGASPQARLCTLAEEQDEAVGPDGDWCLDALFADWDRISESSPYFF